MKNTLIRIISLLVVTLLMISFAVGCSGDTDTTAESRTEAVTDGTDDISVTEGETDTEDAATTVFTDTDTEPQTDTETNEKTETETETEEEVTVTQTEAVTTETVTTEKETTAPDTTAPETTAEETTVPVTTAEVTTGPATTAEVTTAAETTKEQTATTEAPKVLDTTTIGQGRVLIYGTAEPDSAIRTTVNGSEMTNKCKDKYFYIEVGVGEPSDVYLYATADGKAESSACKVTVTPTDKSTSVWGGKDSRLFYMETLNFLIGNRADESSLNSIAGFITNKTISEIQKVTGKETKLIYAIIPDPATAYYDEQFKYVQDYVLNPSTSAMMSFTNKLNGMHKDVYTVDLFSVMRAHKGESIYFTTDTHYTELGAYYAYLEIMKKVKADYPSSKVRTVENGDYKVNYLDVEGGDLCGMVGFGMNEVVPFFEATFSDTGSYYNSKRNDGIKSAGFGPSSWERNSTLKDSSNPTAYFIADSYGCYILPFIGANFSKVWTNEGVLWNFELDKTILAQNKPDYVIILVCQRNVSPNFMDSENRIRIASMSVQSF